MEESIPSSENTLTGEKEETKPRIVQLKTGADVNVNFSSDEDDDDQSKDIEDQQTTSEKDQFISLDAIAEAPEDEIEQEMVYDEDEVHQTGNQENDKTDGMAIDNSHEVKLDADLSIATSEESTKTEQMPDATELTVRNNAESKSGLLDEIKTPKFSNIVKPPPLQPTQNTPEVIDFESALALLKSNKAKKKAKEESDAKAQENEEEEEESYETITTSGGRKFRTRARPELEEEAEEKEEEEINYSQEIEIGDLRGLEEDERLIIVPPKEESTVEASGEDDGPSGADTDGSDGPTSETVQGVKIKFKSKAQLPQTMIEEAEMAALDKLEVVTAPLPPMKPEPNDSDLTETELKLESMPLPPGQPDNTGMVEQWDWEDPSQQNQPTSLPDPEPDSESIVSSEIQISTTKTRSQKQKDQPGLIDIQKSLGDKLLEAFNEEEFVQEELKDIRKMNKQKYLEEKTIMSDQRKAQAEKAAERASKPKRKSVGFAEPNEEEDDEQVVNEPKEPNQYLPESKPKSILKDQTIFDESLQGSSFNTPKPQRKAKKIEKEEKDNEEDSSSEEESTGDEDESSEEETETESTESEPESDPYEDDIFAGKGELAGRLASKKFVQPGVPIHPNTEARVVFKLRDPDPQMVAAWRREFRDCSEVQITCGKVLEDEKWDAVMMPMTNSFGWTDVEPEKPFIDAAKVEGDPLQAKIQLEHFGELLVGQSLLLQGKKDRQKNCKFVIAAPIMRVPIMISQTVNPYLAMRSAIQTVRRYNMTTREPQRIRSVLFPGLGHGMIGRMPHYRVAHQMRKAYDLFALEKDVAIVQGTEPGKVVTFHVEMNNYKLGHKV